MSLELDTTLRKQFLVLHNFSYFPQLSHLRQKHLLSLIVKSQIYNFRNQNSWRHSVTKATFLIISKIGIIFRIKTIIQINFKSKYFNFTSNHEFLIILESICSISSPNYNEVMVISQIIRMNSRISIKVVSIIPKSTGKTHMDTITAQSKNIRPPARVYKAGVGFSITVSFLDENQYTVILNKKFNKIIVLEKSMANRIVVPIFCD